MAGGEKYLHRQHNMFFKLAVDSNLLYGGDEGACKAAGNELKGIMEYSDCKLSALRVPLVVMIDYLGCRLLAEPILPISRDTLVYGSGDGGKTIQSADPRVNELMARAAKVLNLTTHTMQDMGRRTSHQMSSCLDIEVHRSTKDGRLYLLDAARAMPPTTPAPWLKGCNLYRLFRPEFVRSFSKPLCPDAYGGWPLKDRDEHQKNVDEATAHLLNVTCPAFVTDLIRVVSENGPARLWPPISLSAEAHRRGINMRYMGFCSTLATDANVKQLLITETVARTMKNVIRLRMRKLATTEHEQYYRVVIDGVNGILLSKDANYWGLEFKRSMEKRFPGTFSADVINDPNFDVRRECHPRLLLHRLLDMLCLQITERSRLRAMQLFYPALRRLSELDEVSVSWKHWRERNDDQEVILIGDIIALTPRVKTLNVLPYESANVYLKSNQFEMAYKSYQESIEIKPSDLRALHNWGISYTMNAVELARLDPDKARALFARAESKYRVCISVNARDWVALYLWGNLCISRFLALSGDFDRRRLLSEARDRYETAWMAKGGSVQDDAQRTHELLYSWGLAFLLDGLLEPDESVFRAAATKFREASKIVIPDNTDDPMLSFRTRYNLGLALSRTSEFLAAELMWEELAAIAPSAPLYGEWSFVVYRKIEAAWGRLGEGYGSSFAFEKSIMQGVELWCKAVDACSDAGGPVARILDGWARLLVLWSELRFKRYGFNSVRLSRSDIVAFESDEEESSTQSSSEEEDGTNDPRVAEEVYAFNVDFFLYIFVRYRLLNASGVGLTRLAPLGAVKESILSSHTIQTLLLLAEREAHLRRECERALKTVCTAGGNHKLKLDATVTTVLTADVTLVIDHVLSAQEPAEEVAGDMCESDIQGLDYDILLHGKTLI